jgi:hypothetical protein
VQGLGKGRYLDDFRWELRQLRHVDAEGAVTRALLDLVQHGDALVVRVRRDMLVDHSAQAAPRSTTASDSAVMISHPVSVAASAVSSWKWVAKSVKAFVCVARCLQSNRTAGIVREGA